MRERKSETNQRGRDSLIVPEGGGVAGVGAALGETTVELSERVDEASHFQ